MHKDTLADFLGTDLRDIGFFYKIVGSDFRPLRRKKVKKDAAQSHQSLVNDHDFSERSFAAASKPRSCVLPIPTLKRRCQKGRWIRGGNFEGTRTNQPERTLNLLSSIRLDNMPHKTIELTKQTSRWPKVSVFDLVRERLSSYHSKPLAVSYMLRLRGGYMYSMTYCCSF